MKKLRLLITEDCHRSCKGCCNKDWDLANLPKVDWTEEYSVIMLTGGEPLLDKHIDKTIDILKHLCTVDSLIVVYTSLSRNVHKILNQVDGITLTLHEQSDIKEFIELNKQLLSLHWTAALSLRLNVFDGIEIPKNIDLSRWKVKDKIVWLKDCPLPTDEVFMRI